MIPGSADHESPERLGREIGAHITVSQPTSIDSLKGILCAAIGDRHSVTRVLTWPALNIFVRVEPGDAVSLRFCLADSSQEFLSTGGTKLSTVYIPAIRLAKSATFWLGLTPPPSASQDAEYCFSHALDSAERDFLAPKAAPAPWTLHVHTALRHLVFCTENEQTRKRTSR
jgi:hypothetical protein